MKKVLALITLSITVTATAQELNKTVDTLNVGDEAPHFQANNDKGETFDSKKLLGKQNLVVYFYPAAMTGGCTSQACSFRDEKQSFEELNTKVVGVSGDSVQNLAWFKQANNLNFTLVADPDGSIAKAFGVPLRDGDEITRTVDDKEVKLVRGVTASRWTFIIDKTGAVIYKDTDVNAAEDTNEVLAFLQQHAAK